MISQKSLAAIVTILFLVSGLQAFVFIDGVANFNYFQTGKLFEVGSGDRTDNRYIAFTPPFATAPRIILAIKELDVSNQSNVRIDTYPTDVSRDGFSLNVHTWDQTKIYSVAISWIAYTP